MNCTCPKCHAGCNIELNGRIECPNCGSLLTLEVRIVEAGDKPVI